jgi:hypothetical protein
LKVTERSVRGEKSWLVIRCFLHATWKKSRVVGSGIKRDLNVCMKLERFMKEMV